MYIKFYEYVNFDKYDDVYTRYVLELPIFSSGYTFNVFDWLATWLNYGGKWNVLIGNKANQKGRFSFVDLSRLCCTRSLMVNGVGDFRLLVLDTKHIKRLKRNKEEQHIM